MDAVLGAGVTCECPRASAYSRYPEKQYSPLKSINGPFCKSQHPNFESWLIIGLLRRYWQRHLEVHQCRLQAQELYFKLGTFSSDSMEVVCLHLKVHVETF